MSSIKQLTIVAATFVAICASACTKDKSPESKASADLATRFLTVSEIHSIYSEAYAAAYRDGATRDRKPEKEINCVMTRITPDLLLPVVASAYAQEFNEDELAQAISFYESETGKTYVRNERLRVKVMFGKSTEAVPEYSSADMQLISTFEDTRIGHAITAQHSPVSEAVKNKARPLLFNIFRECEGGG